MDTGDDHGSIILLEVEVLHVEEEIWIFILGIWHLLRHVFEFGLLIELKNYKPNHTEAILTKFSRRINSTQV